ncbi:MULTISPECIES: helix-turn-helix domain-containing protein [Streptomyces]|uniref:helix-turn-helix domain-containing protein n=1 Tax=Streptomyces TaxID=1883 RepID=UPI001E2BB04F|nr:MULTISPECIES: AraC family transcriptional regulator [Streptomyces]UFQ19080.1 AraC family transcriptional regulator [Streptomyces huasconensis]WCL88699.1 AraC family transcriptional regulator [Streptomyces sp. JCM 35825]
MEADPPEAWAPTGWEVARPVGGVPFAGVEMAGFRDRDALGLDARVLPHPAVTVVLELGEEALSVEEADARRELCSIGAGLTLGRTRIKGRGIDCVEIRLSPVTAYATLDVSPPDREGGAVIDLAHLWGRQEALLREQLWAASGWAARFALLEEFLAERLGAGAAMDPEVVAAWRHIVARQGQVRVGDLAASCGWSRKRLWSRFAAQIGMTPKRAAMLVRFDRAVRGLSTGRDTAEVASACGYADQPHLHRDVRHFAACTPAELSLSAGEHSSKT